MAVHDLPDLGDARRYIQQGLWLQRRIMPPATTHVRSILEWSLEIASSGAPLPPVGFVADIGVEAFGMDRGEQGLRQPPALGLAAPVARAYEDQVLGRIYADWAFERGKDALKKYAAGRDRVRGLAFLIEQFHIRAQLPGVLLPPSIIRAMMDASPHETLRQGLESLRTDGLMPLLEECYHSMIDAARRTAEWLAEADIRALENGIALASEGQQLAHELVVRAKIELGGALPQHKPKPLSEQRDVPTRVLDEDAYPVGGFSSISTRGGVESLLQSQLAYMEKQARPDLFDIKYLRDELYYYARDENQFLRRRRRFVLALYPDLAQVRIKEPEQHYQRIVYLLGMILAAIEKLTQWLSSDALQFDFVFLHDDESFPLHHEYELIELLLLEQIENGTVRLYPSRNNTPSPTRTEIAGADKSKPEDPMADTHTEEQLIALCKDLARRHLCHLLTLSVEDRPLKVDDVAVSRLMLNKTNPRLIRFNDAAAASMAWPEALESLLQMWV
jgi:hypothetical protein